METIKKTSHSSASRFAVISFGNVYTYKSQVYVHNSCIHFYVFFHSNFWISISHPYITTIFVNGEKRKTAALCVLTLASILSVFCDTLKWAIVDGTPDRERKKYIRNEIGSMNSQFIDLTAKLSALPRRLNGLMADIRFPLRHRR